MFLSIGIFLSQTKDDKNFEEYFDMTGNFMKP